MENRQIETFTSIQCSMTSSKMEYEELEKFLGTLNAYILKIYPRMHTMRYEVTQLESEGKPTIMTIDQMWSDKGQV